MTVSSPARTNKYERKNYLALTEQKKLNHLIGDGAANECIKIDKANGHPELIGHLGYGDMLFGKERLEVRPIDAPHLGNIEMLRSIDLSAPTATDVYLYTRGEIPQAYMNEVFRVVLEQSGPKIRLHLDNQPQDVDLWRQIFKVEDDRKISERNAEAFGLTGQAGQPDQAVTRNAGTFADILAETKLGQFAIQMADSIQMPRDTTVLTALGVVSAPVSMIYNVSYRDSGFIPTSLYVATEQPASTGKSAVLNRLTRPIQNAIKAMNSNTQKLNEEMGDGEPKESFYKAFMTDTTPEALDGRLAAQYGHFCLASAEQAIVNTALGVSYGGERKSNNDLILKGYSGDWHSSERVTRKGYEGDVFGAVTVIAQRGTIDTILERSDGTGIAERFIMLAEPTLLGYRDHLTPRTQPDASLLADYESAVNKIIEQYEKCKSDGKAWFEDAQRLHLSRADWDTLNREQQRLEPMMADGGKYSHEMLRGVVGKYDQRVMKLASVLHVIESLMAGGSIADISSTINPRFVTMAIGLADLSIDQLYQALVDKDLIGMSAEEEAVYNILTKRGTYGVLWGELYNAAKGVQPFKSYPAKGKADKIRSVCQAMADKGKISSDEQLQGGRPVQRIFAL